MFQSSETLGEWRNSRPFTLKNYMQSNLQNEHGKNGLYVSISDVRRYSNFHMAKFCKNKFK